MSQKKLGNLARIVMVIAAVIVVFGVTVLGFNPGIVRAQTASGSADLTDSLKGRVTQFTCSKYAGVCGTFQVVVTVPQDKWHAAIGNIPLLPGTKIQKVWTNWETNPTYAVDATGITVTTTVGLSGNIYVLLTGQPAVPATANTAAIPAVPPFAKIGLGNAAASNSTAVDFSYGAQHMYVNTLAAAGKHTGHFYANVPLTGDGAEVSLKLLDHTSMKVTYNNNPDAILGTFDGPGTITVTAPQSNTFYGIDGSNILTLEYWDTDSTVDRIQGDVIGIDFNP